MNTAVPEPIQRYLNEHAEQYPEEAQLAPPAGDLKLCVVIPALAERDSIGEVIQSLDTGAPGVEVIVVVNNATDAPAVLRDDNLQTIDMLKSLGSVLVVYREYPPGVAGVGAARRTGMDLALRRLATAGGCERGAIVCLDADSPVSPGYLEAILSVFDSLRPPLAGVCSHRHRLPEEEAGMRAIVAYELWLRYIECGFRVCGSPYAFQTVGSCTVASPTGYALADGMPRRQAGEDFYFLQKIIKAGGPGSVVKIPGAVVHPSARISSRVPFGTGRAMTRCTNEGPDPYLYVEPPEAFLELRHFFQEAVRSFDESTDFRRSAAGGTAPERLDAFLEKLGAWTVLDKLRENAPDADHFLRSVHEWFDSLQVVRYARTRQAATTGTWLFDAIARLLDELGITPTGGKLPVPEPGRPDLDLQIGWLSAVRDLDSR